MYVVPPIHEGWLLKCRFCKTYFATYHDYCLHMEAFGNDPIIHKRKVDALRWY